MNDTWTTLILIGLSLLSLIASVSAIHVLRHPTPSPQGSWGQRRLVGTCAFGSAGVFAYRALVIHHSWQPLEAHVDGLLLIACLFAATVLYLQGRARMHSLVAFSLPMLTLILAWAVCASAWTFHPFQIGSVWMTVHLTGVYLGTLCFIVAAIAGVMYLYAQRGLQLKQHMVGQPRLASLEALEGLIIRTATVGFALLTLGLVMGVIITVSRPSGFASGGIASSKVLFATASWCVYAVVANVRSASRFRGARAAWLSIVGLVLLLTTFGLATALPGHPPPHPPTTGDTRQPRYPPRTTARQADSLAQGYREKP